MRVEPGAFDARVRWERGFDGGKPPQLFTLLYRKASAEEAGWRRQDVGEAAEALVAFLHPDVLYEFKVEPRNSLGPGFASPAVQVPILLFLTPGPSRK